MAFIKQDSNSFGLPMNIERGNSVPLDSTEVWYSLEKAKAYARVGQTAYVGQKISVVDEENDTTTVYVISNEAGDLVELITSETAVKSISNEDIDSIFNN